MALLKNHSASTSQSIAEVNISKKGEKLLLSNPPFTSNIIMYNPPQKNSKNALNYDMKSPPYFLGEKMATSESNTATTSQ
jgi:hypothetical protein